MKNHYDTLGVRRDASLETIKAEFRKLSMELHPDVGGSKACAEKFKEISVAAHVLTNEKRRRVYDYQLREAGSLHASHLHHRNRQSSPGFGFARTGTTTRPGPGAC